MPVSIECCLFNLLMKFLYSLESSFNILRFRNHDGRILSIFDVFVFNYESLNSIGFPMFMSSISIIYLII
jgi:hypothetical protein